MEAAERIFDGAFDDIPDEGGVVSVPSAGPSGERERWTAPTRLVVCTLPRAFSSSPSNDYRLQKKKTPRRKRPEVVKTTTKVDKFCCFHPHSWLDVPLLIRRRLRGLLL
jgi:hypothetical protein